MTCDDVREVQRPVGDRTGRRASLPSSWVRRSPARAPRSPATARPKLLYFGPIDFREWLCWPLETTQKYSNLDVLILADEVVLFLFIFFFAGALILADPHLVFWKLDSIEGSRYSDILKWSSVAT